MLHTNTHSVHLHCEAYAMSVMRLVSPLTLRLCEIRPFLFDGGEPVHLKLQSSEPDFGIRCPLLACASSNDEFFPSSVVRPWKEVARSEFCFAELDGGLRHAEVRDSSQLRDILFHEINVQVNDS